MYGLLPPFKRKNIQKHVPGTKKHEKKNLSHVESTAIFLKQKSSLLNFSEMIWKKVAMIPPWKPAVCNTCKKWVPRIAENLQVITPLKTNMTIENQPFEDVSPIKTGDFFVAMFVFRGVKKKNIDTFSLAPHHWDGYLPPIKLSIAPSFQPSVSTPRRWKKFGNFWVDSLSRWWLNQAIWKIWSSKWLSSPRFWVKIKKMKSPPSYVYNYPEKNKHGILEKKSWFGKEKHLQTISFGVRCFFFSGRKCSKMSGFKYIASHKQVL